jgi:alkylhydroperoxidase family enzyme
VTRPKVDIAPLEPGQDAALYLNSLTDPGLVGPYMAFYVAACRTPPEDPELVELIRLRNGVAQSCRYCLSVRLEGGEAFDEDMPDTVVRFEDSDLTPRQKAALRLADAFLTLPQSLTPEAREEALRYFSPEEIVGLMLRLTSFLVNKPRAALGIDGALDPGGLTQIDSGAAIAEFTPR